MLAPPQADRWFFSCNVVPRVEESIFFAAASAARATSRQIVLAFRCVEVPEAQWQFHRKRRELTMPQVTDARPGRHTSPDFPKTCVGARASFADRPDRRVPPMAVASKKFPRPISVMVRRALLSVSDKTGLIEFAQALTHFGIELVSTGGTAKAIAARRHRGAGCVGPDRLSRDHGRPGEDLASRRARRACSAYATIPSMPRRCAPTGIEPIDLVVVNLYPFEATVRQSGADYPSVVENIDIGGPGA